MATHPPFLALAALVLTVPTTAQEASEGPRRIAVTGTPVRSHLDLASGVITTLPTAQRGATAAATSTCFANSNDEDPAAVSSFADALLVDGGDELVDWGVMFCENGALVEAIEIGYASQQPPTIGCNLTLRFYAGYQGFGTSGSLVAEVQIDGLPSDGPQIPLIPRYVHVDLGDDAFFLPEGPIGWSYTNDDGLTAPLMVDMSPDIGNQNWLDWYSPGPVSAGNLESTFSLGPGGWSNDPYENSLFMVILENDGAQTADVQLITSPQNPNALLVNTAPAFGGSWDFSFSAALVPGIASSVVLMSGAQQTPPIPTSYGDLLIVSSFFVVNAEAGLEHSFGVPSQPQLLGVTIYAQGVAVTATDEILTNAYAGTIGF